MGVENARWQRVIGIVGGLGPYAHLELERRLLANVESPSEDAAYPEWILSSIPQTPDRTVALMGLGPSPVPWLVRSLERLSGCADFAVIGCITAHAFLPEVRREARLPILDLVATTLGAVDRRFGPSAQVGVLATTGTLRSGLFARTGAWAAPGLQVISLLDLEGGEGLQESLVMRPVYGPLHEGRRLAGGIKSGDTHDPETGIPHRETLARAAGLLAGAGAVCVITGCTEIPLALGREEVDGLPLVDPLDEGARAALAIARGELPLPATSP
jgi:aspartate racemase